MFLPEDTNAIIALAEEEEATCPKCGMLKVWCRDPDNQFAFDAVEEVCWVTYRRELRLQSAEHKGYDEATRPAVQVGAVFRKGHEPDLMAGLGLGEADPDD